MKTASFTFPAGFCVPECFSSGSDVYFDIETTGLDWRRSHIYLIGAAVFHPENDSFELTQWFADRPEKELDLLKAFAEFLTPFQRVIHYNGTGFDLPYLQNKYSFYHCTSPLDTKNSLDLYRIFRPLRSLFGLSAMKQKNLESFTGFHRKDIFSGGELIPVYEKYLSCGEQCLLDSLLLHNREDITGLIHLLSAYGFFSLFSGHFEIADIRLESSLLIFVLIPDTGGLIPVNAVGRYGRISADNRQAVIEVSGTKRELKFFFDHYKDYYYLPLEDNAVHKSVGAFVDADHREKAKAANCYQRRFGLFFPQPSEIILPVFREKYKSKECFFEWDEKLMEDIPLMRRYACDIFASFCLNSASAPVTDSGLLS